MIKSMTGYGKAECLLPDKKLTIEIRSLNSKQLDTSTRLPALYREKELEIRQIIAGALLRGKVECTFYYELTDITPAGTINEDLVRNYYSQLQRIADDLGLKSSTDIFTAVLRLPDTIRTDRVQLEEEEWDAVKEGLQNAIHQLNGFRHQEGEALTRDLRERVKTITEKLNLVRELEGERITSIRERIGNNLSEFLSNGEADENRLEQEIIYYLEKLDISEEKVRLANHCSYFLETLGNTEPVGKKLGFITQEMGREINTLGSKANHAEIQRLVVEMKDELERIKEQVLNVL
jgi:uncharacterized protein (TIGR00255 family)